MNVIAAQFTFVVMAFAVQMHQVELIDQPLPLQQVERPVDGASIDRGVDGSRLAQDLAGVQMPGRGFNHT